MFHLCNIVFFVAFILSSYVNIAFAQDSLNIIAEGEFKHMIASQNADSFAIVKECIMMAQANAIESVFGKVLMQKTSLDISNMNVNDRVTSNESFKMSAEGNLTGRWVKDITPPIVDYYTRNKELWISIKVKGYVREIKPKSFNEDREAMANYIKQLYLNSPFADITIVENYSSKFLISVVALNKANYKSLSDMNRVASLRAISQINRYFNGSMTEEIFIIQTTPEINKTQDYWLNISSIKETSSGLVNNLELLTTFIDSNNNLNVFVYSKQIDIKK
jgi:hypothetical protein